MSRKKSKQYKQEVTTEKLRILLVGDNPRTIDDIMYVNTGRCLDHVTTARFSYDVLIKLGDKEVMVEPVKASIDFSYALEVFSRSFNAIIVCFDVDEPESFNGVTEVWLPRMKEHCPEGIPIILCGANMDSRKEEHILRMLHKKNQDFISFEQGRTLSSKIDARAYIECSARTEKGIQTLFRIAAQAALTWKTPEVPKESPKTKTQTACVIL